MSEENTAHEKAQEQWSLKLKESQVSPGNLWGDDVLDRQEIAQALTKLIANEPDSLVISLSGDWGTGKTFLLQRWQEELKNHKVKAIYFNAWEDDFCDDPLVAIIGQLSEKIKGCEYEESMEKVRNSAKILFKQTALATIKNTVGISLDEIIKPLADNVLENYDQQRKTKDKLKESLRKVSQKVKEQTNHPLVFIIDELDRCRPTFAIQLLERVKHIFEISNIIFVFGINRKELCSSVNSIYGEIESDIYLRRFFDMEFLLPAPNSEEFCKHCIGRYRINELFEELIEHARVSPHRADFNLFHRFFPVFCNRFNLSLRDIDYCIRSVVFIGKKIEKRYYMYPLLVSTLVILRLKEPDLYRRLIQGKCFGSEVMDYVDKFGESILHQNSDGDFTHLLDVLELQLYAATRVISYEFVDDTREPFEQLELLQQGRQPSSPYYISERTRKSGQGRASNLLKLLKDIQSSSIGFSISISYLSSLVELAGTIVKR